MELRPATAEECRARDAVTHPAWGAGLDLEAWRRREALLRAHPWPRAAMTTWFLSEGARCLASCESFRVPSAVGDADGVAFAVASVFTEPALRRRGHALALMRALVARLAGEPSAQAVVLFSEVGPALYQAAGFRALPAFDAVLPPLEVAPPGLVALREPVAAPASAPAPAGTLVLRPTAAQLDWHLERERFYAAQLGRRRPSWQGARLGGSSITWTAYFKSDELLVLWLTLADEAHLAPLLAAARFAAFEAGLARVRLWEVSAQPVPGAQRVERADALPMFAPLAAGVETWAGLQRGLWV